MSTRQRLLWKHVGSAASHRNLGTVTEHCALQSCFGYTRLHGWEILHAQGRLQRKTAVLCSWAQDWNVVLWWGVVLWVTQHFQCHHPNQCPHRRPKQIYYEWLWKTNMHKILTIKCQFFPPTDEKQHTMKLTKHKSLLFLGQCEEYQKENNQEAVNSNRRETQKGIFTDRNTSYRSWTEEQFSPLQAVLLINICS